MVGRGRTWTRLAVLFMGGVALVRGNMYDLIDVHRNPDSSTCPEGCAAWANLTADGCTRSQADVNAKWSQGHAPAAAGRYCAAPGMDPGVYGSWCYCKNSRTTTWAYCVPKEAAPEQINLQLASGDKVVISFVTFESAAPTGPPSCTLTLNSSTAAGPVTFKGATHAHSTPAKDRVLYLHFVKASGLTPRGSYTYTCKSGGPAALPSQPLSFRAPYAAGPTRLAMFGDMGVYAWNNMGNLVADCDARRIDAVVHIGDHAYNEGDDDERRADGYMNAYQGVLSQCPWMPIVGNHEYYSSEYLGRYMDSTWENWQDVEATTNLTTATATSALGALLSRATFAGPGVSGPVPSGTSRWFSADIGLVHLIALDLNLYFGSDSSSSTLRAQQADWLKRDLAAANANRANVPWIIANSHFPFYCSECASQTMTASWYAEGFSFINGTEVEHAPMSATDQARIAAAQQQCAAAAAASSDQEDTPAGRASKAIPLKHVDAGADEELCDSEWATTVGASTATAIKDLIPTLHAGGVDMYMAGHWHYYESLWPMGTPSEGTGGPPTQRTFVSPTSTVHITTGNGGPPSKDTMDTPMPALRNKSNKYGYGRVTAFNATHLLFEQVLNGWAAEGKAGEVFDSFYLVQPKHGPFAMAGGAVDGPRDEGRGWRDAADRTRHRRREQTVPMHFPSLRAALAVLALAAVVTVLLLGRSLLGMLMSSRSRGPGVHPDVGGSPVAVASQGASGLSKAIPVVAPF